MKPFLRIISLVLAFSLLAACQSGPAGTPTRLPVVNLETAIPTATPVSERLQVAETQLSGQVVDLWLPWLDDRRDQLSYLVDDFNATNGQGIRVNLTAWGGEQVLLDELAAALEGGEALPGIALLKPEEAFALQASGLDLVPLDEYLYSSDWGYSQEELADWVEPIWSLGRQDGVQYGIPVISDGYFLFYNLTWGMELGFNGPPEDQEDFLLQACKAGRANLEDSIKENNGTGGWLITTDAGSLLSWFLASGSELPKTGDLLFEAPEYQKTFEYLKNLQAKDCAWLGRQATPYDYLVDRYALFVSGSLADIQAQQVAFSRKGSTDQWLLIPYPVQGSAPASLVDGTAAFLVAVDPVRDLAGWIFLRWLDAPTQQARFLQVTNGFPSRNSMRLSLQQAAQTDLTYTYIDGSMDHLVPVPNAAAWTIVRRLLEDASWQVFQPETKVDRIATLLQDLNAMISELTAMDEEP